jgi:hypothetical protein
VRRCASQPQRAEPLLSRRTVEYHLHKVFTKLGVASRMELARLDLADTGGPGR